MLPASNRLKLSSRSKTDLFKGRKFEFKQFRVIFKKGSRLKAAIIVSKKVVPKAHERNRIKRVITEALRTQLEIKGEVIIIVKENIAKLKTDQVAEILKIYLGKIR